MCTCIPVWAHTKKFATLFVILQIRYRMLVHKYDTSFNCGSFADWFVGKYILERKILFWHQIHFWFFYKFLELDFILNLFLIFNRFLRDKWWAEVIFIILKSRNRNLGYFNKNTMKSNVISPRSPTFISVRKF